MTEAPPQVPPAPGPMGGGGPEWWIPTKLAFPSAPATPTSQAAVYLVGLASIAILAALSNEPGVGVTSAIALGVGVAVSIFTKAGSWFTSVPGIVCSLISVVILMVVTTATDGDNVLGLPLVTILLVGLFVLGLDWRQVKRLRALVLLSGAFAVMAAASGKPWDFFATLGWVGLAFVALWSLECDQRNALTRPRPLHGTAPSEPNPHPGDLARTIALALVIGVGAAFIVGVPSCSPNVSPPSLDNPMSQPDIGRFTPPNVGDALPQDIPPERSSSGQGRELTVKVDADGNRYVEDQASGQRYPVTKEGNTTVARDENGRVVAEIDGSGITAHGDKGTTQRYGIDENGRAYVEGASGERLYLEVGEDGELVLRASDGSVVARGSDDGGHLYLDDSTGNVLVPDPDGDGRIPLPPGAVLDSTLGPLAGRNRTYESNGDSTTVRDNGSTRTYDRDGWGRDRVTVTEPGKPTRVYVYETAGPTKRVYEYDAAGTLLRSFRYDPEGVIVEGPQNGGSATEDTTPTSPGSDNAAPSSPPATPERGPSNRTTPWKAIALAAAAIAAVAIGAWWLLRRSRTGSPSRSWAEQVTEHLDQLGRDRGTARGRSETVIQHTAALAATALPDPRLPQVG
ncbi:MAG: hypothetical protein ABIP03_12365, partial [Aquihabitans sp.]